MKARFKHSHAAPHSTTAAERKAFQNVQFSDLLAQSPENPGSCRFSFCKGICACAASFALTDLKHGVFRPSKAKCTPQSRARPPCGAPCPMPAKAADLSPIQPQRRSSGRPAKAPPSLPRSAAPERVGFYNPKHRASVSPHRALATASFAVLLQKMLMRP